jgi:hypothetical protein
VLRIANHYVSKIVFVLLFVEVLVLLGAAYIGAAVRFIDLGQAASVEHRTPRPLLHLGHRLRRRDHLQHERDGHVPARLQRRPAQPLLHEADALVPDGLPDPDAGVLRRARPVLRPRHPGPGVRDRRRRHLHARMVFFKSSELRFLETRILFLGSGPLAKECSDLALQSASYHRYNITGFIPTPTEELCVPSTSLLKSREGDTLVTLARQYNVEEIVVSVQNRRGGFPIKELLECKLQGLKVTDAATFFERETCQIRVDSLQPSWLVFGGGFDQSFVRTFMKRSFDLVCSMIILVLTFPLMLLAALAVKLEDRGPVFYSQERVGKDGKTFHVHKFRSMRTDAEKSGKPQWAQQNDPRVTRVGNFMRKTRIDELPQILNVFKGEMSFVGPRPERPTSSSS